MTDAERDAATRADGARSQGLSGGRGRSRLDVGECLGLGQFGCGRKHGSGHRDLHLVACGTADAPCSGHFFNMASRIERCQISLRPAGHPVQVRARPRCPPCSASGFTARDPSRRPTCAGLRSRTGRPLPPRGNPRHTCPGKHQSDDWHRWVMDRGAPRRARRHAGPDPRERIGTDGAAGGAGGVVEPHRERGSPGGGGAPRDLRDQRVEDPVGGAAPAKARWTRHGGGPDPGGSHQMTGTREFVPRPLGEGADVRAR